ncbi:CheR family methyltransferase [Virgibacillus litoralis]|uniref:Chemotaxis protein methyltransferase CheR n=1 Tax=Virgibacillus litoralis TaxID=578221 RepID=A0ABS4HF76_9BACI|nr:protein-glutamate O-methyltransferase CheR [Virgibacillus litoralis]MBP1949565.1 chemotaxis protein methyltransferase CheR [Virgibacillus litoralis]
MSQDYINFVSDIKRKLEIDLTLYKETQMKRRLTSLREKRGYLSFKAYFKAISQDELLLNEFLDRITINVSEFYRNPKRWEVMQSVILPSLLDNAQKLTIWSAACSTGEEPYSIALMMKEHFPNIEFQILATDIDNMVLARAKKGTYTEQSLKELPDSIKHKFFKQESGLYHIDEEVKRHVRFKKHDLLADVYPRNMDLIVCRNVLIYFTNEAKNIIYQNFSDSLKRDGVLFVGSTEQIFSPDKYNMSLIDTFFYQKND